MISNGSEVVSSPSLLADLAQRELRKSILLGELPEGTHLVETQLAELLTMSRGPVRQALARLEQEGLIVRFPHQGAYVARFERSDVEEIFALRRLLDGHAVSQAAGRLPEEHEYQLRILLSRMKKQADADDRSGLVSTDVEFHRTVCASLGFDRLLRMWETLVAPMATLMLIRTVTSTLEQFSTGPRVHGELLDAIVAGEAKRAQSMMQQHLDEAEQYLVGWLESVRDANSMPTMEQLGSVSLRDMTE